LKPIWVLTLLASFFLTGADPNPNASWQPRGTYWDAYRSVIIKAVCDTLGNIRHTELLYSAASPAETDSIMEVARQTRFDTKIHEGRVRKSQYEPFGKDEVEYIAPYAVRDRNVKTKPLITRKELEQAGLGRWLAAWDRLLPDWPVETWSDNGQERYYEYTSNMNDSQMMALDMVSVSPDRKWHLHPFVGMEFDSNGRPGFDIDGGFVVYMPGDSVRVRQHVTGTPVNYTSAEWIDKNRFVVTATESVDLNVLGVTFYRAPLLYVGDVNSREFMWIAGPPVPIEATNDMWRDLGNYEKVRYIEG
jgi:hypothetical protein